MQPKTIIGDVMGGTLIAILDITTAISIAALLFTGLPSSFFLTGVTILLLATAICAIGGVIGSAFYATVMAPRSGLAPVYAGMVATIAAGMPVGTPPETLLATIIMGIMLATMISGIILFALGQFRLGGLVRYIPYPVMGGFFAGIGLIFVLGGFSVATSLPLGFDTLEDHLSPALLMLTAPTLAFGIALYVLQRKTGHWAVFPGLLALGMALFYLVLNITDTSMADAVAMGWLADTSESGASLPVLMPNDFDVIVWSVLVNQVDAFATIALLSAIILLLDTSGIEIIGNCELDPNRELKAAGITNFINGACGGYTGLQTASDTAFVVKLGSKSRLMGITFAAIVVATIMAGTGFIGTIPTFILGGLLMYLGMDFLIDWAWATRRDLPFADYCIILIILVVIATFGLLEGVAFGFFVAIILFVISYSRLGVIKNEINGADHASHVVRNPHHRQVLDQQGHRIHIIKLQGFIFFGTADGLLEVIRARLEAAQTARRSLDYLVLDFANVSALDSSAIQAFTKLLKLAERERLTVILTNLTDRARQRLNTVGFFTPPTNPGAPAHPRLAFEHLDEGVAWCEADILAVADSDYDDDAATLGSRLIEIVEDADAAKKIAPFFEPVHIKAGSYLFHQGDPGDSLYVLNTGIAAVIIVGDENSERAIRIFEQGTLLGEMAIYTRAPRSASVRIEEDGLLFKLSLDHFNKMQEQHPRAAGLFHAFVVRLLAERLDRANRELQKLQ